MKGFLLFIVGAIAGAVVTFGFATGIGAGAGIVTGMRTGACLAVEAAKEKGFIAPEQVNEVLSAAGKQIASGDHGAEGSVAAGNMECEKVIADLKAAAGKAN